MARELKVFYMERSDVGESAIESFKKNLCSIVEKMGYFANITTNASNPNASQVKKLMDQDKVDLIVCDLTLGTDDYDGLKIIRDIKSNYPEILVCGYSRSDISYSFVASQTPSFDFFIDKSQRHDEYLEYCAASISELLTSNIDIDICFDDSIIDNKKLQKIVCGGEFRRLLKKITFTTHSPNNITLVKKAFLVPLKGGYSSSEVFKMACETSKGETIIKSVLKLSPIKNAKIEIANYLNFVKWYLPYTWRPEMLSYAYGKNYGMICYSFAYNDQKPFSSMTENILEGNIDKIDFAVNQIFSDSTKKWYSEKNRETVNEPISKFYTNFYFEKYASKPYQSIYNEIKKLIMERGGSENNQKYYLDNQIFPSAKGLLVEDITQKYITCIFHGDLNTNNIMISEDNEFIFIDFQETGIGHVFHDFIVFEMCLKLYHNTNIDFKKLLEIEMKLANDDDELATSDSIIQIMQKVRRLAFANTPEEDHITYNYGLAMRTFRLLKSASDNIFSDWQKDALLACLLANLHVIENKNKDVKGKPSEHKTKHINKVRENECDNKSKRFEIGLSFPGEYREQIISKIADGLESHFPRKEILYDLFHKAEFARPNLDHHLQKLYHDETKLIVVFLGKKYNEKTWCGLEWRAIRDLLNQQINDDKIMFVRVDDGDVNGVYGRIDGYISVNEGNIDSTIKDIIERYTMLDEIV